LKLWNSGRAELTLALYRSSVMKLDAQILESLADLICGDDLKYHGDSNDRFSPTYRTGGELSRFFARAGIPRFQHDGSTRKWWVLEALRSCSDSELKAVILRLANPKEYNGSQNLVRIVLRSLNQLLNLEGLRVRLNGVLPVIEEIPVEFSVDEVGAVDLKPMPPPDFMKLGLEPGIGEILSTRWEEAEKCVEAAAHVAAVVMMGSLLEGMILAVLQRNPSAANKAQSAPRDTSTGKPKQFWDWNLSQMIDVAHELHWIDLDVKQFSHSLRQFRNLIHPYQQLVTGTNPDEDTCKISWLVVQAAANDLARTLEPKQTA
jgi:hypothetical protein